MKVIVVKPFRDVHTGEIYKTGTELNITKKRYNEILSVGNFVEEKKSEEE